MTITLGCSTPYRISGRAVPGDIAAQAAVTVPATANWLEGEVPLDLRADDWVYLCHSPACDGEEDRWLQMSELPASLPAEAQIKFYHRNPGIGLVSGGAMTALTGLLMQYAIYDPDNPNFGHMLAIPVLGPVVLGFKNLGGEQAEDCDLPYCGTPMGSVIMFIIAAVEITGIALTVKGGLAWDDCRERPTSGPLPVVFNAQVYPGGGAGAQLGFRF